MENHSLFGFHFDGNYGYTDEKMHLVVPDKEFRQPIGK